MIPQFKHEQPKSCVACGEPDTFMAVGFLAYWCQVCGSLEMHQGQSNISIWRPMYTMKVQFRGPDVQFRGPEGAPVEELQSDELPARSRNSGLELSSTRGNFCTKAEDGRHKMMPNRKEHWFECTRCGKKENFN